MALTPGKARKILEDGTVHGRGLTDKQKKYFGAIAGGATPMKKINGGWLDKYQDGGNTVMYGTPEYEAAYREGRFADVPNVLDEVVITSGVDYNQYPLYDKLSAQQKEYFNDPGPIGRGVRRAAQTDRGLAEDTRDMVTGMLVKQPLAALQAPQSLMVEGIEALRGRDANFLNALTFDTQRTPSQAFNVENPYGAFALDVLADPLNVVGVGLAKKSITAPFTNALKADASVRQTLKNLKVPNLTNPLSDTRVALTELKGLIKGGPFKSKFRGFNESGVNAASDFGKTWQKAPGFQTRFDDFTYQFNDPSLTRQVRNNQNLYKRGLEQLKRKQPDLFTPSGELTVPLSTIQKMFPRLADDAMVLRRLNDQIVEGASKINYANNARMNADQIGATGRFTKVMKPTSADDIKYFADNPNTLGFFRASENRALIDLGRFEKTYPDLAKRNYKLSRTVAHENKHAMDAGARATKPEYARTIQSAVPQVTDDYTKVLTGANKKDIKKVYGNIKNLGDDTAEKIEYLSRPQEVAARIDELRMEYIPKKFWGTDKQYEVSDDLINKIISEGKAGKTSVDVRFFKMIKDKEAFKNLFKVLPAVAAPVAIGSIPQQRNGGRCWPGYKTVSGKTPFSKGSCQKAQDGYIVPPRKGVRKNTDGSESTHLMKAEQLEDGTWVGFPSLFQNEDGKWIDMSVEKDWMNIYNEALKRGEVVEFGDDKKSAIKFGEGSWKSPKMKNGGWLDKFQEGGVIEDDRGQWAYPGEITKINSNNITMKGVNYPVLGISDTGDKKMMQPGKDYKFKGNSVTEYPMAQAGEKLEPLYKPAVPGYDQKEFLRQWANSPMGQNMLLESFGGNEKALEELTKKRTGNLDIASINIDEDLKSLGRYKPNDHSILVNTGTSGFQQVGNDYDSVLLHELSHSQDYTPGSQFNKSTIPLSDQKLIRNLSKDSIKNAEDRKTKKENRYLADPTETRARLNVVRDTYERFKDNEMPSVFDSEFTPSMLEEVKGTSQFEELQQIYTDDEIIQLLNTVSDNAKSSGPSNMAYAKQGKSLVALDQLTNFTNYNTPQPGGWLDKY